MARGIKATPPPAEIDPLAATADDLDYDLSYSQMLARAGAYRQPGKGIMHKMPVGPAVQRGGKWVQQTKAYPVAMSAEEAREKTRATGDRWDYYEAGTTCDRCVKAGGDGVISGWVLGGRKFAAEHEHVTNYDPTVFTFEEVAPPDDAAGADAPLLVEA